MLLSFVGVVEIAIINIRRKSNQFKQAIMDKEKIGDKIIKMEDEPHYKDRVSVVCRGYSVKIKIITKSQKRYWKLFFQYLFCVIFLFLNYGSSII